MEHFCRSKKNKGSFTTFSGTQVKVCELEVCFIASSKLYDWRGIQIYMFVENCNTKTRILKEQTGLFLHSVLPPGGKTYQTGFLIFSSTKVIESFSSQRQNYMIGVGFKYTCLLTFDL